MTQDTPTISANKLAEYIVSKGARQRRILHDRKYPDPDFSIGMYHKEAQEAISLYLADGAIDPDPIDKQIQILEQLSPGKIGTIRRINSNISALERFQGMLDDIDLKGAEPQLGSNSPQRMTISNVKVSVRPDIILRGTGPRKKKYVGALKLHFSTTDNFNEEAAGYVSAIVQVYCKDFIAIDDEVVNPNYCQVIDVADEIVYPGVKATAQRMKDIQAECLNIFDLWPRI